MGMNKRKERKVCRQILRYVTAFTGILFFAGFLPAVSEAAVKAPVFSQDSGIYGYPFQLSVSADSDCTVYYSEDGSIPVPDGGGEKKSSLLISVKDRNGEPNVLSAQKNTERMYMAPGDPEGYEEIPFLSAYDVPKATVIRAVAVNNGTGERSKVITKTYFIGNDLEKYGDVPVISLVTDPKNLVDDVTGILVTGLGTRWSNYNYNQSGREWEREADIEYFDENKEFAFRSGVGIRVQGGYNRRKGQKSLNVYFREEYGMKNLSNYRLIPDACRADGTPVQKYKGFVLRNGGNDGEYTKMRDAFTQKLLADRNFTTQAGRPCVVYINGEYWGFYTLIEKYGTDYLEEKYGVNEDNVIIIKVGELDEGLPEDMKLYEDYRKYENIDMSVPANYEEFCEAADIQSFIDYFAAQTFISNEDWPNNNYRLWRTRTAEPGNPHGDEKWRWMMYDTEFAMGLYNSGYVSDGISRLLYNTPSAENTVMFRNLMKNPEFCRQFVTTMMDLCNVNFRYETAVQMLYEMSGVYGLLIEDYYTRFGIGWRNFDLKIGEVDGYFSSIHDMMQKQYLPGHFAALTGISSSNLADVTLTAKYNNAVLPGASIKLNTVTPDLSAGKWTGRYYSSLPVTVTANVPKGYEFDGWTVTGGTAEDPSGQTTEVTFQGNTEITANYKVKKLPDYVIINQVYGTGDDTNGAVSHGFIELYNPTGEPIPLDGYSIQYAPGEGAWQKYNLDGKEMEPKQSFLIRCTGVINQTPRYTVADADLDWNIKISNRAFEVALVSDQETLPDRVLTAQDKERVIDLVGAQNTSSDSKRNFEGTLFTGISKQKSVCRKSFFDNDNNGADFVAYDYRVPEDGVTDGMLGQIRPRYSGDGKWGVLLNAKPPVITKQIYVKNAKRGGTAVLEVGTEANENIILSYQWYQCSTRNSDDAESILHANRPVYEVPTETAGTFYYYCKVTATDPEAVENQQAVSDSVITEVNVVDENAGNPADHVIINQAYGSGDDGESAVSHGFVELYNPTDQDISLNDYTLQYAAGKSGNTPDRPNQWKALDLKDQTIKAHHSFLVLCDPGVKAAAPRYTIAKYDKKWDITISNRAFQFALVKSKSVLSPQITNEEYENTVDMMGAVNDPAAGDKVYHFEGSFCLIGISKQKSARRKSVDDRNETAGDFESLDYRSTGISDSRLEEVFPRYSGDGEWGIGPVKPPEITPDPPVTTTKPPETTRPPVQETEEPADTAPPASPPSDLSQRRFTVTFQSNGGTKIKAVAGVFGNSRIKKPKNPVKKGYVFAGWYREAGCKHAWNFGKDTVKGNTTLYAKWKAKTITLTFHANKGKIGKKSKIKSKAVYGKKIKTPRKPKRKSYKFKGWYTKKKGGKRITNKSKVPVKNKVYYAHWK